MNNKTELAETGRLKAIKERLEELLFPGDEDITWLFGYIATQEGQINELRRVNKILERKKVNGF